MPRVAVDVMLKREILDPQGQAVERALPSLGFDGVSDVRIGKHVELTVRDGDGEQAARPQRVQDVGDDPGAESLSVLGYCMGAPLSSSFVASYPEIPVKNYINMAGPIDFSKVGMFGLWLDKRRTGADCPPDPFENEQKYPGVAIGAREFRQRVVEKRRLEAIWRATTKGTSVTAASTTTMAGRNRWRVR